MSQSSAERRRAAVASAAARIAERDAQTASMYKGAQPVVSGPQVEHFNLSQQVYEQLEKNIPRILVPPTSEIEAAWIAGAEFVLRKLRGSLVIPR